MIPRMALAGLLALLLPGCTTWNLIQDGAAVQGARAADEFLVTTEFGLCKAVTMGAWQRRFGNNPKQARAWMDLCGYAVISPVMMSTEVLNHEVQLR